MARVATPSYHTLSSLNTRCDFLTGLDATSQDGGHCPVRSLSVCCRWWSSHCVPTRPFLGAHTCRGERDVLFSSSYKVTNLIRSRLHPTTCFILIISLKALQRLQRMHLGDTIQTVVGLGVRALMWSLLICHPTRQDLGGFPYSLADADTWAPD